MCNIVGKIDLDASRKERERIAQKNRRYLAERDASIAVWRKLDVLGKRKGEGR